jgi:hypothetical protein
MVLDFLSAIQPAVAMWIGYKKFLAFFLSHTKKHDTREAMGE